MDSTVQFLRQNILLHGVPDHELEIAAAAMRKVKLSNGTSFIAEGTVGECCYFIMSGQALVASHSLTGRPIVLDVLKPGALVGEIALILQEKRTADVKALGEVTALRLNAADFARLAEASPMFHESLLFSARIRLIHGLLRKATIWSTIPDAELRGLAEVTSRVKVGRGERIITEGTPSSELYMVAKGRFEAVQNGRRIGVMGSGDCFGEADLLLGGAHSGTVTALEDGELLLLGESEFHYILQQYEQVHRQFIELLRLRRPDLADLLQLRKAASAKDDAAGWNHRPHSGAHSGSHSGLDSERADEAARNSRQTNRGADRWIDVLLLLGGLFVVTTVLAIWQKHPVWIASALLVGGVAGPVAFVAYMRGTQLLGYRLPRLAQAFLLSAATAAPAAWLLERYWLFRGGEGSRLGAVWEPIAVSLLEETLKLLVCVLLLRSRRERFLMDGIVFGAAVGMGFAAAESILYGWTYLQQGAAADMLAVLWVRALLSPFGHGTWTAIAAAGLWYGLRHHPAGARRSSVRSCRHMMLLLFASFALHALWDNRYMEGAVRLAGMIVIGVLGLLLLYRLLRKGMREERAQLELLNPLLDREHSGQEVPESLLGSQVKQALVCDGCGTVSPPEASYCARCGQALRVTTS